MNTSLFCLHNFLFFSLVLIDNLFVWFKLVIEIQIWRFHQFTTFLNSKADSKDCTKYIPRGQLVVQLIKWIMMSSPGPLWVSYQTACVPWGRNSTWENQVECQLGEGGIKTTPYLSPSIISVSHLLKAGVSLVWRIFGVCWRECLCCTSFDQVIAHGNVLMSTNWFDGR